MPGGLEPRQGLDGDGEADVAIVGAGLTGCSPDRPHPWQGSRTFCRGRDAEGDHGHGRRGGWAAAAAEVDCHFAEVGRAAAAEVDCHFVEGGTSTFARSAPQRAAARTELAEAVEYGVDPLELRESDGITSLFDPNCARPRP